MKNTRNQRQFKGGYIPEEPVDEWNRAYRKEPASPSKKRDSRMSGTDMQARPGLAGIADYSRKPKGKK